MGTPVEDLPNPFLSREETSAAQSPAHRSREADASTGHDSRQGNVVVTRDGSTVVDDSAESSRPPSRPGGAVEKKRVGFWDGIDSADRSPRFSWPDASAHHLSPTADSPAVGSAGSSGQVSPMHSRQNSTIETGMTFIAEEPPPDKSHLPELSPQQTQEIHDAISQSLSVPRPRPAIRRPSNQTAPATALYEEDKDFDAASNLRWRQAQEAYRRGKRLADDERLASIPNSRQPSPERGKSKRKAAHLRLDDIPMHDLRPTSTVLDTPESEEPDDLALLNRVKTQYAEALVRKHTQRHEDLYHDHDSGLRSGAVTPTEEQRFMEDYQPRPTKYRGGVLGSLLKLYNQNDASSSRTSHHRSRSGDASAMSTPCSSPPESGSGTPTGARSPKRHWYGPKVKSAGDSTSSLAHLIGSSANLGSPVVSGLGEQVSQRLKEQKEQREQEKRAKRRSSANPLHKFRPRADERIRITVHIGETIARQKYLIKLCKALMVYGAPTHRLEEYMRMSARVLEIEAQFLYLPGAMIMSFDDPATHTTEVKLVKAAAGLDLGRLRDVHEIYKEVVHDRIGVEEATSRLNETMGRKEKFKVWLRILVYGFASACVGPFAFDARLIDLPMCFVLGCILGILQLIVAPQSDLYANVFEIAAAVITSFLARALGSIPYHGERLFCFSALAQSSIALILPGYTVLCASLELQSKSIVAGSVRMVYAIIYSLFLGYGITIGTAIYGLIDRNATSETTCSNPITHYWFFFFVPGFTLCLCIVNQAKWKQVPVMMFIAFAGYVVNYFSARRFAGNTQVSNTLGALCIGVLANMYSRVGRKIENKGLDLWEDRIRPRYKAWRRRLFSHSRISHKRIEEGSTASDQESLYVRQTRRIGYGVAAAAMLPAIFVQVPSGLAVNGSLVSGIASADQITGNGTNGTAVVNGTNLDNVNSVAFNVGYSVIQVAIGITVGLFLSAIVVYPFGKKRSGLFSF